MRSVVQVTVETDGQHPSWKEIDNRNDVIRELADQNLGRFLWAGQGKGSIAFAFEVHNEQEARGKIGSAMTTHLPGWKYALEVQPRSLAHTFEMHSRAPRRRDLQRQFFNGQRGMGM
jgi:hypothetical protein